MSTIFQDIWKTRSIIFTLAINDLKLRYKSSVLGFLWSFLEPLLILSILFIVFSSILKNNIPHYAIFLLLGIIMFQMFSRSIAMGMESVLQRSGIISSVKIPIIIFPIAACLTALFMMSFEFVVLFVFMIALHYVPPVTILFLPIVLSLLFFLGLGLAIPFSAINIHYRDLRASWTIVLQATFFLTPVVYKLDFLPESIRSLLQLNPLVPIINMSREAVLENILPTGFWFFYSVAFISLIFIMGLVVFKHYQNNLVEKM